MSTTLSNLLERILSGDVSGLDTVLAAPHNQVVMASKKIPKLLLEKRALLRILTDWKKGAISSRNVQLWASFVRRGYAAGGSAGAIEPIDIPFEDASESLIADVIGRLDELGDVVDGSISGEELTNMIERLNS